ncbi:DIS3-like exonuclease 1 [Actinia tenebrosa]|uniref:DIS3-like exonuclease 1 n=1 Tax=Actinia tenebrosa TaxID=6105 RepID=A0A6P8IWP8_ACTTE|nr:DIS3-like exonuclease 1 [Actinia tenebrosa]XP_031571498.1 DIS3-like exonuclease 1 [Actinia tenebrosa]
MLKTDKKLRLKTKNGRFLNVVREHYLRDDVACHSQACQKCQQQQENIGEVLLSSDLTHYVVPDIEVTSSFLELFEFPEIQGVIFFQTVINHLQHHGSRKLVNRIKELTKDKRHGCVIFSNEFCKGAYTKRLAGETLQEWQQRNIFSGAKWYYNHLKDRIPIVMVTNDRQSIDLFSNQILGVFVLSLKDYLNDFYSGHRTILDLYDSLRAVIDEEKSDQQVSDLDAKNYVEYLPLDVLEAGIKSGRYYQGCLNVNKHNSQSEAFIQRQSEIASSSKSSLASDILIQGMVNRNRAIHGDIVVVELFPKPMWKGKSTALNTNEDTQDNERETSDVLPTGHVVGVLQRNWRDYMATFSEEIQIQSQKSNKVLVAPWDYRIPRIRISTRQIDSLRDHRIVVRIDSWDINSMYPNGHFVRSLGVIGNLDTEISTIMLEHSLFAPPFTDSQLKELPSNRPNAPWVMDPKEIEKRRDLRSSHLVFSIDPKGCEDVDDTLSIRSLSGGRIELGVHIADVTYFVKPGSLTDAEARSRSTTVYLADRRYDMLPEVLSADLCSLISGVDRYAMSVIWEMDSSYNVINAWYGRTVIRSSYKLFYEVAQAISEGQVTRQEVIADVPELQGMSEDKALERLKELRWSIMKLMEIARHLKFNKTIEGALELEGLEVQVQLNENKDIKDLSPKKPLEVHETIAECMIFANHWVAKKIAQVFPTASLLRRHPLPRQQYFSDLIHCAESRGFSIETSSNKLLADSLDECVDPGDPTFNKILRTLATQAMSNALYFSTGSVSPEEYFHYGLALDRYTHFTSPIRRYADVIVHRLLMAAVGTGDKTCLLNNKELEELCHHINTKHRAAQLAQKESVQLFETLFFQSMEENDERRIVDAIIFSIRSNGLLVFVPKYSVKGPVYLKDKNGQVVTPSYHTDDGVIFGPGTLVQHKYHVTVHHSSGTNTFQLFDHVQVRVSVLESRAHCQSLRMDLISLKTRRTPPSGELIDNVQSNKMKRSQLVKEVQNKQENSVTRDLDVSDEYKALVSEYGQTHPSVSLYALMEHFREMSLTKD